uniref:Ig-like domain-containing protein n=1 Tax=Astyanax mexicanus TaxID=7994 RepID=A0A8B9H9D1_ASTMX
MAVMKRDSILNIFLTVSVLICLCHGRYVNVPQSVTAVKGSCVTLPCSTSSHSHVIWYQYVSGRDPIVYSTNYGDITDHFRGRTSAPGSSSQGDCSLRIYRVRQGDNSEKLYPWIQPDTGNDYHLVQIYIVNPENPHISIDNQQVEGKLFSATCSIRHSCPSSPPPVEWIGLSTVSNSEPTTKEQGGLWTTVFQAKFKPSLQDHEKYLRCQSIFSSQTTYSNAATSYVSKPVYHQNYKKTYNLLILKIRKSQCMIFFINLFVLLLQNKYLNTCQSAKIVALKYLFVCL